MAVDEGKLEECINRAVVDLRGAVNAVLMSSAMSWAYMRHSPRGRSFLSSLPETWGRTNATSGDGSTVRLRAATSHTSGYLQVLAQRRAGIVYGQPQRPHRSAWRQPADAGCFMWVTAPSITLRQRAKDAGVTNARFEVRLREIVIDGGGFSSMRRAVQTPFNFVLEAKP
jgi:hypothetical protein